MNINIDSSNSTDQQSIIIDSSFNQSIDHSGLLDLIRKWVEQKYSGNNGWELQRLEWNEESLYDREDEDYYVEQEIVEMMGEMEIGDWIKQLEQQYKQQREYIDREINRIRE